MISCEFYTVTFSPGLGPRGGTSLLKQTGIKFGMTVEFLYFKPHRETKFNAQEIVELRYQGGKKM